MIFLNLHYYKGFGDEYLIIRLYHNPLIGNPGKGRALGVGTVKFTGEVLQNVKIVKYEINMKKIMSPGGTTVGLANGVVLADVL